MFEIAAMSADISAVDYHTKHLGIASKSALDQIDRSPAHYIQWLVQEQEQTPAMRIGSLVHRYVLEREKAMASIAVMPAFGDCRKADNKAAKADWMAENADKDLVTAEELAQIQGIGESVRKHPIASRLVEQATPELSLFWVDPETGLECKARVDGWCESIRVLLDLKTTANASPVEFAKSCHNYRYHVQAAFYLDGIRAVTDDDARAFLFIAVEKEPPFAVKTYQLDAASIDLGRDEYRRNMRTLKECLDSDEWPAYGTDTETISLPTWAFRR